jgi:fatty-acyl-CoA synthase
VFFGRVLSYAEVQRQAERLAARLHRLGVRKGDRVLLNMQNCPQWVIAHFAILRANAVVVPVNPMNRAEELKHYITDPDAKVAITTGRPGGRDRQGQRAAGARRAAGAPGRHAVHRRLRHEPGAGAGRGDARGLARLAAARATRCRCWQAAR